jgi:nitroreductase
VITDAAKRARLGELYAASLAKQRGQPLAEVLADPTATRTRREAAHLALRFGEVPVHIVACDIKRQGLVYLPGSSIYPACQNLMLAAWALGLGTVLTTIWKHEEAAVRALLAIPDDYELWAVIPLGWPARAYGPPQRLPLAEVAFRDGWGQAYL